MTLESSLGDNAYQPIPRDPPNGVELDPKSPVVHRVLTILPSTTEHHLIFTAVKPTRAPAEGQTIQDYAEAVARKATEVEHPITEMTPYDIDVTQPCFVLLELDRTINWEFSPNKYGVTSKVVGFDHENYGLRFVADGASAGCAGERAPPSCHLLYFGVLGRKDDPQHGTERGFNFEIDFHQVSEGVRRRLPTIFDPNVPNTGGAEFP